MAIVKTSVWGHTPRPWGYEVRVDFEDAGAIYNEVMTFKTEPDAKELDDAVLSSKSSVESRIAFEAAEALKPLAPTVDELLAKVTKLEAEKVVLEKAVADAKVVK